MMVLKNRGAGSGSEKPRKAKRVGLLWATAQKIIKDLLPHVPSRPWADAQIVRRVDREPDGTAIVYRFRDKYVFPPGGAKTAMVPCVGCGVSHPVDHQGHVLCYEHDDERTMDAYGASPSAVAIRVLQMLNVRKEENELEMEPEDTASLEREIAAFRRQQRQRRDHLCNLPQKNDAISSELSSKRRKK